jgi:DNA-binding Lrp family transcriptional regulator
VSVTQAKILKELIADGRNSPDKIAKKLGLSKESVKKDITKMEKKGIITGATTHINYRLFGYKAVAHIQINVDSHQADQLLEYLQKMPEVYSAYSEWIKGNVEVVATLKTLEQLSEIKDSVKRNFSVLEMKTAIWTDVKEMNDNLAIIPEIRMKGFAGTNKKESLQNKSGSRDIVIDQIDQKIADKLAENGRISMGTLGKEVGISSETAKRRYEKLKENGVLKVTVQINPYKIGYRALCIFFTVTDEKSESIIEKIGDIPDIISVMKTTGDYDLQIYAMVQDIEKLLAIQKEIGKVPGIIRSDVKISGLGGFKKWPSPRQYISTF